jgi:hypothetical protein
MNKLDITVTVQLPKCAIDDDTVYKIIMWFVNNNQEFRVCMAAPLSVIIDDDLSAEQFKQYFDL